MRSTISWIVVVAILAIGHGTASAGRTFYGWLYGTEVLPERGAELQTWLGEQNRLTPDNARETDWWVGALVGITDQLELALPVQTTWVAADGGNPHFTMKYFGGELRYRLVTQDPVDAPALVPLVRLAVLRDVTTRNNLHVEADAVVSYEMGIVHVLADVGVTGDVTPDDHHFELHPGAGASIKAVGDLRFGAEGFASVSLDDKADSWAAAGPNMAWTHGRFWLSAAYGIGLYHIRTAPRIVWGIAF